MPTLSRRASQISSHVQQMLLFRRLFDPATMLMDVVRFPVDRYLRDGRSSWPTTITLVVRSECNVRCVMCHSMDIIESREPRMSLDQIRTFIDHLGPRRRRPSLFLTGGEPFLRKDILEVIALIKAEGMACGVVTNGTLLPPERIARLVELDVDVVVFSLHGSEEVHDAITQRAGSYRKLTEAVRGLLAARRGTRVVLNCAITEHNHGHLDAVIAAGERLGVDAVRFEHLNFVTPHELEAQAEVWERLGDPTASVNSYVHQPTGDVDYAGVVEELSARRWKVPVSFKPSLDHAERVAWYGGTGEQRRHCTYPWRSLFVTASGDVYPCLFMLYKVGNLLEQPLEEVWNGERMVRFRREVGAGLFPACARCCKL